MTFNSYIFIATPSIAVNVVPSILSSFSSTRCSSVPNQRSIAAKYQIPRDKELLKYVFN